MKENSKLRKIGSDDIKRISLDILIDVASFCEKNNIRYYLACGTLLGAVRHKGFIPWDDDVDIMMPRLDGFSACRKIKEMKNVPVIMLSARSEEEDKLFSFSMGIDDYVTKPFSPKELMARIKAVSERNRRSVHSTFRYENLVVDFDARDVFIDNERVNMTPRELDLLIYFIEHKNMALDRDKILSAVWDDYYGDERTVDTHVKMLRKSLGKYRDLIKTVRGMGYKLEI